MSSRRTRWLSFCFAIVLAPLPRSASAQISSTGNLEADNPTIQQPTWNAGMLFVGINNGSGSLTIGSGGTVTTTSLFAAWDFGLNGLIDVNGGTLTSSGTLFALGNDGSATLIVRNGGTVTLLPGTTEAPSTAFLGSPDTDSVGLIQVSGGSFTTGDIFDVGRVFSSAEYGDNRLEISGTGAVVSKQATINDGFVDVSGGTWNITDSLDINYGRDGELDVHGSGSVVAATVTVYGDAKVRESGSLSTSTLNVDGTVQIDGGSLSASTQILFGHQDYLIGVMTINGGHVTTPKMVIGTASAARGTLNLNGGILTTENLTASPTRLIVDSGQVAEVRFNGGTLQLAKSTSELLTFFKPGEVTMAAGGGTIDTQAFNATTAYGLSGAGMLTKQGSGRLTLSGANTYTGGTTVNDGTLAITGSVDHPDSAVILAGTGNPLLTLSGSGALTSFTGSIGLGEVRVSAGTWKNAGAISLGTLGNSALTISGGTVTTATLVADELATGAATITLNGGVLETGQIARSGSPSATFGFNGGTLRLGGNQSDLFSGFAAGSVTLGAGGGTLDTQAFTVKTAAGLSGTGALTKTGTGTLIVTGDLAHTGGTTITSGTLQIGNGGAGGSITADIVNNANLAFNHSGPITYDGAISGTGALRILGSGVFTPTGTNTHTGGTYLSPNSTVRLEHNAAIGTGSIYVDNATIDYADGVSITNTVRPQGSIFDDSNTFKLNVDSGTATQGAISEGAANFLEKTGAGTLVLTSSNTLTGGVILSGGTLSFGASNSSLGSVVDGTMTFNGGTLRYTRAASTFSTFRPVSINANDGTIDVIDASSTVVLVGELSGTGTFNQTGAGTVKVTGAHSGYTGAIAIAQGRFQLAATTAAWSANAFSVASGGELYLESRSSGSYEFGSLAGAGNVTLAANSGVTTSLIVGANNTSTTFDGNLSTTGAGTGSLTKLGTGTLTLTGTNTYTGATTVSAGQLVVDGSLASESVAIAAGASLGGSGSFGGLVTLASGATLAPGNSPGTLTFSGGLTLESGANLDFELGTASDLLRVSGGTLTGPSDGTVTLNLVDSGGFAAATYILFDFSGATTSSFDLSDFTFGTTPAGYTYALDLNGSTLELTASVSAVPEPSTYAALAGLAALGCAVWRRRRTAAHST